MHFLTFSHYLLALLLPSLCLAQETPTSTPTSASSPTSTSASTSSATPSSAPSLPDAAGSHDAGRWGDAINNARPSNARGGSTAFIPVDDSFPSRFARQGGISTAQYLYQVSDQLLTAASLRAFTGSLIGTFDTDAGLGGRGQAVLSHGQRDTAGDGCSNATSPISLYSGLGNNVTILEEDIPFDGGILHIISGPFTRPTSLSNSLGATSETTSFASYLSSVVSVLDTTPSITVFAPSNDALTALNSTTSASDLADFLVDAHIISGTVAYSPLLINGARFRTLGGDEIVVSADPDGTIRLNEDVTVVRTDIVISNGVVHVIDGQLSTSTSTSGTNSTQPGTPSSSGGPSIFTGAALSIVGTTQTAEFSWRIILGMLVAVLGSASRFWF